MTLASKFFAIFPAIQILLILISLAIWIVSQAFFGFLYLLFSVYLFPLICFQILIALAPIREGKSDILEKKFSPWWAGHQIQSLFIAVPALEAVLKIIPGAFSVWLRCWGSKIGKKIYWTPGSIHYDRNLLEIGDNVVFGEQSLSVGHIISPKDKSAELTIAKVKIGKNSFIGAAAVLSPGVVVEKNSFIKAGTRVYPFENVKGRARES